MRLPFERENSNKYFEIENEDTVIRLEYSNKRLQIYKKLHQIMQHTSSASKLRECVYAQKNNEVINKNCAKVIHELIDAGLFKEMKKGLGLFAKDQPLIIADQEFYDAVFYERLLIPENSLTVIELSDLKVIKVQLINDEEIKCETPVKSILDQATKEHRFKTCALV